jgi:hypothetical protein
MPVWVSTSPFGGRSRGSIGGLSRIHWTSNAGAEFKDSKEYASVTRQREQSPSLRGHGLTCASNEVISALKAVRLIYEMHWLAGMRRGKEVVLPATRQQSDDALSYLYEYSCTRCLLHNCVIRTIRLTWGLCMCAYPSAFPEILTSHRLKLGYLFPSQAGNSNWQQHRMRKRSNMWSEKIVC